jgi:hypothetical protein
MFPACEKRFARNATKVCEVNSKPTRVAGAGAREGIRRAVEPGLASRSPVAAVEMTSDFLLLKGGRQIPEQAKAT